MASQVRLSAKLRLWVFLLALSALLSGLLPFAAAGAQDVRDHGTTTRGLVRDRFEIETAQIAVAQAGGDCEVMQARLRGRDATGTPQFEVSCRNAPGYLVIGQPVFSAINCLTLEARPDQRRGPRSGAPRCELSGNRNPLSHYQRMARQAGLTCRVDEGRFVGLSPGRREIYEVGCSEADGAWIERANGSEWTVKACMTITAEGGRCLYSDDGEAARSFADRLQNSQLSGCAPTQVRPMGESLSGSFYELVCANATHVVARFSPENRLEAVIPCVDAAHIGDGCKLR